MGLIPYYKNMNDLSEEEFDKFDSRYLPDEAYFVYAKNFFKTYLTDDGFREIIESGNLALLNTHPNGDTYRQLSKELRVLIPEYIKNNVDGSRFVA
jgi:type I restriction enzyme R subunit